MALLRIWFTLIFWRESVLQRLSHERELVLIRITTKYKWMKWNLKLNIKSRMAMGQNGRIQNVKKKHQNKGEKRTIALDFRWQGLIPRQNCMGRDLMMMMVPPFPHHRFEKDEIILRYVYIYYFRKIYLHGFPRFFGQCTWFFDAFPWFLIVFKNNKWISCDFRQQMNRLTILVAVFPLMVFP